MDVMKWDGSTNARDILKALLYYIDEDDKVSVKTKSYGDFALDLRRAHRNESMGNSKYHIEGKNTKVLIELHEYGGVTYELTWNKAAKLLHSFFNNNKGGK